MPKTYTILQVVKTLKQKGYLVYTQPYQLNIVGIRSNNKVSLSFDDFIAWFYYDDNGKLQGQVVAATTDPSVQFLKNPKNSKGTAILKSGQYVHAYQLGMHKGKYKALVQIQPVTVIRDNDRDGFTTFRDTTETGLFGINIHRASRGKQNETIIGPDSEGCQVLQNENDYNNLIAAAEKSANLYGNNFTYTLIDERDVQKKVSTGLVIGVGLLLVSYSIYWGIQFNKKAS